MKPLCPKSQSFRGLFLSKLFGVCQRETIFETQQEITTLTVIWGLGLAAACGACQPSAEAGAGPVAERARVDEFGEVGRPCGETSELAIALMVLGVRHLLYVSVCPVLALSYEPHRHRPADVSQ